MSTKSAGISRRKLRVNPAAVALAPSFILVFIFVYVFIAYTIRISLSKSWMPGLQNFDLPTPWYGTYHDLFTNFRFQADLRNTVVFTILFLILAVVAGLFLAIAVSNMAKSKVFFRNLFLMPYAVSFIVTGVIWRWIFNPVSGVNLLLKYSGISSLYEKVFGSPLKPQWMTSPEVFGNMNSLLSNVIPGGDSLQAQMGVPIALLPVIFAAAWQLCGFAMAMFLAGLASIPHELREAAAIDRASGFRYYWSIAIPSLIPMAVTATVILTSTSLKIFDLIYAMSGSGIGFSTDMPGIYVYESMYKALRYPLGAAASVVMLVLVSAVVLPYLVRFNKGTEE
jgi:glucose/mannose transport system permease protein